MVELYEHQKTALNLLRLNDGFALFMEQGTGKTFPILFRLAELAHTGRISKALIAAPKAVCSSWEDKIRQLSEEQREALESIELVIASYDIVWRHKDIADSTYDAVVFDESHYIKSPSAKRTKGCLKLASRATYRWILTGTPTSNGQLCNLWSQFAAITPIVRKGRVYPECFDGATYADWLDSVAYLNKYHKPYKYKNVASIQKIMEEISYRITKEECLDLPEKMPDEILHVKLKSGVIADYRQMVKSSAILELDTLAGNPLTRSLRLRQIASGFIETENDEHVDYPCAKLDALREFLEDFEKKVVVFCEFRNSIDTVSAVMDKLKMMHVILDGRQQDKSIWQRFQVDDGIQAIICQYQSGSTGIDLYAADTCIFFEPTLSSNLNEQAKDRIHRVGQTRACSYVYLITDHTIEAAIYGALCNYEDFGEALFTRYIGEYTKGARI